MSNAFDDLPDDVAATVEVVPGVPIIRSEEDLTLALRQVENELLEESTAIVQGALRFARIDPTQSEPPARWIEQLGYEQAVIQHRLALIGWSSKMKAPVGLEIATRVMLGIQKQRSLEKTPKQLNVQVVQLNIQGAPRAYEPLEETENA